MNDDAGSTPSHVTPPPVGKTAKDVVVMGPDTTNHVNHQKFECVVPRMRRYKPCDGNDRIKTKIKSLGLNRHPPQVVHQGHQKPLGYAHAIAQ